MVGRSWAAISNSAVLRVSSAVAQHHGQKALERRAPGAAVRLVVVWVAVV
jgi:hypothetical protein